MANAHFVLRVPHFTRWQVSRLVMSCIVVHAGQQTAQARLALTHHTHFQVARSAQALQLGIVLRSGQPFNAPTSCVSVPKSVLDHEHEYCSEVHRIHLLDSASTRYPRFSNPLYCAFASLCMCPVHAWTHRTFHGNNSLKAGLVHVALLICEASHWPEMNMMSGDAMVSAPMSNRHISPSSTSFAFGSPAWP